MKAVLLPALAMFVATLATASEHDRHEKAEAEVRKEVVQRCRASMGEYGAAMVKACVDQDMQAYRALKRYPDKHGPAIARCKRQMGEYGWAMVKACADQDIAAEEALESY